MTEETNAEAHEDLLEHPSIHEWEVELRRVLSGERLAEIMRVGGTQQYVEMLLAESVDPSMVETCFQAALQRVIQAWDPIRPSPPGCLSRVLDLIRAFHPFAGHQKLLGYALEWGQLARMHPEDRELVPHEDIWLKLLLAIKSYYPVAPYGGAEQDPAFTSYLRLLRGLLDHAEYCSHAVRRLIELEIIQPRAQIVQDLIEANQHVLPQTLQLLLSPGRILHSVPELSAIYEHCLLSGQLAELRFEQALHAIGAEFKRDYVPQINLRTGETLRLQLTEDARSAYIVLRWDWGKGGRQKWDEINYINASDELLL